MADDLWVFGYGSLIWHPGFDFDDRRLAVLRGYRRAFCMTSIVYRGTPEAPGLVLALDADAAGSCAGVAYHVPAATAAATLAYLRERELVSYAYDEARVALVLDDGRAVEALAYVSNRAHPQYRGGLTPRGRRPRSSPAPAARAGRTPTICSTPSTSLEALGLHDPDLVRLAGMVRARIGGSASPPTPDWPDRT